MNYTNCSDDHNNNSLLFHFTLKTDHKLFIDIIYS